MACSCKTPASKLVLYDFPLAYHPAKPRLMLIEKGLPYETRFVHLFNGESLSPAFLKENPAGTVPVLRDGDVTVLESLKIVRHVDQLGAGPLGGDQVDRAFVQEWGDLVDRWDGNLFLAAGADERTRNVLGKLTDFRLKYIEARKVDHPELREVYECKAAALKRNEALAGDAEAVRKNEECLVGLLDTAEQRLAASAASAAASSGAAAADGPWLAGPAYSQADVLLSTVLFRLHMGNKEKRYLEPRPALSNYCARVQQRPSWNQAFGPAFSGGTKLKLMLPAIGKAWWRSVIKKY